MWNNQKMLMDKSLTLKIMIIIVIKSILSEVVRRMENCNRYFMWFYECYCINGENWNLWRWSVIVEMNGLVHKVSMIYSVMISWIHCFFTIFLIYCQWYERREIMHILKDKAFLSYYFRLTLPVMIQQLLVNLVSMCDTLMISSVGEDAISAVAVANKFFFIYSLAMFGLTNGVGLYISQYFGAKDESNYNKVFRFGMSMCICLLYTSI